jgi:hypothetical protein
MIKRTWGPAATPTTVESGTLDDDDDDDDDEDDDDDDADDDVDDDDEDDDDVDDDGLAPKRNAFVAAAVSKTNTLLVAAADDDDDDGDVDVNVNDETLRAFLGALTRVVVAAHCACASFVTSLTPQRNVISVVFECTKKVLYWCYIGAI